MPPHITPPLRVGTIGSHIVQGVTQLEAGHPGGHLGPGVQRLPLHHSSLPEFSSSPKSVHYNPSPGSVSTPAVRIREGVDGNRLQRTSSGGLNESSSFQHASGMSVKSQYLCSLDSIGRIVLSSKQLHVINCC